jgi:hypothetical protein
MERVDRVVAMVGTTVVTDSDLRLHIALCEGDESTAPVFSTDNSTVLDSAINAAIIRLLAGTVTLYQPNPAQLRARFDAYRDKWTDLSLWTAHLQSLGLDERRLLNALQQRMVVERLLSRTLGTPKPGEEAAWTQRFEEWIVRERKSIRIRLVAPSEMRP